MAIPEHLNDEERFNIAHQHPTDVDSSPSSPSSSPTGTFYLYSQRDARSSKQRSRTNTEDSTSRLCRLLGRDEDIRAVNALLAATNDRLTHETTRAEAAEHRALEYFTRLRTANEARDRAEQDVARLREELRLYSTQLENAQKEIFRAQDIITQVATQKSEAEADAARARTTARKLQEEKHVMQAREEGRKEGYKDGWARGRQLGFVEAREIDYSDEGRHRPRRRHVIQEDNDDDNAPDDVRPVQRPPSASAIRRQSIHPPNVHRPESTPPVRTRGTPVSVPPPSHELPPPLPIRLTSPLDSPESIHPLPVRLSPSITHRPASVPPERWTTRADSRPSHIIRPPHDLIPPAENTSFGPPNASSKREHPPMRSRDYAYPTQSHGRTMSSSSHSSTGISQYDLVSAPTAIGWEEHASHTPSVNNLTGRSWSGSHSQLTSVSEEQQRQRSETESIAAHWRAENSEPPERPASRPPRKPRETLPTLSTNELSRQRAETPPAGSSRARSPLDYLFRHRFRQRTSSSSIPQIVVESPSQSRSSTSETAAIAHPELLSPDSASTSIQLPSEDPPPSNPPSYSNTHHANSTTQSSPYWPAGFVPLSAPPPSRPASRPAQQGHLRPASRSSRAAYDAAPVPQGVSYPESPIRPHTSSGHHRPHLYRRDMKTPTPEYNTRSSSPAPLDRPFSLFND